MDAPNDPTTALEESRELSPKQTELLGSVLAKLQQKYGSGAQLQKILDSWEAELRSHRDEELPPRSLSLEETCCVVEQVHLAMLELRMAENQVSYLRDKLDAARDLAEAEVGFRQSVPDTPWEVDFWRVGVKPREAVEGTVFLATRLDEEALRRVAGGELHPWLQERVGSEAPAEYYRDVAELLLDDGDLVRQTVKKLCEEPRFLRPFLFLAHQLSAARS